MLIEVEWRSEGEASLVKVPGEGLHLNMVYGPALAIKNSECRAIVKIARRQRYCVGYSASKTLDWLFEAPENVFRSIYVETT